ncbi:MAG: restriction endonuclease subunit S [bacterium]
MRWPEYRLSHLTERFISGGTPSTKIEEYWQGDIPWITGADFLDGEVAIGRRYINKSAVNNSATNIVPKGSILMVTRTGVGKIAIAPADVAISQDITGIVPKSGLSAKYVLSAIRNKMAIILAAQRGATIKGITRKDIEILPIPLAPPSEQRRIVEILDQADALHKKRAEADAKAARILPALFYKMFGDPLTLINSGEGVPLSELEVDLQNGFACGEKDVEDGVPHLRMNNIDDSGVLNLELVRTVPLDRDSERYRLIKRDVLFMGTNSEDKIGKTCLFLPPDERTYLFSNHLIRLRVFDSRITPEYLASFLHLLWSKRFFPSIAKRWVNQSTVAQSSLAALRIPLPDEKPLQVFTKAFQNLLSLRAQRVRSGETLDQTFAVLLHRAFTGDLTAKWREAHMKELLQEMEQQARALRTEGAKEI